MDFGLLVDGSIVFIKNYLRRYKELALDTDMGAELQRPKLQL